MPKIPVICVSERNKATTCLALLSTSHMACFWRDNARLHVDYDVVVQNKQCTAPGHVEMEMEAYQRYLPFSNERGYSIGHTR